MKNHKKINSQFRNSCIFCDSTSTSNEHIFPRWLRDRISSNSLHKDYNRTLVTKQKSGPPLINKFPKNTSNSVLSIQTKRVCKRCNNEWLSQLESQTIVLYERFLNTSRFSLSIDEQTILSTWATILAIKWDLTENNTAGYAQKDIVYIYKNRLPPANVRVWMGHCNDDGIEARHRTGIYLARPPKEVPTENNTRSTAFMIGSLVLHILSHEESSYPVIKEANKINKKLIQIWPPASILELDKSLIQKHTAENLKSTSHFLGMQHSPKHVFSFIKNMPELYTTD